MPVEGAVVDGHPGGPVPIGLVGPDEDGRPFGKRERTAHLEQPPGRGEAGIGGHSSVSCGRVGHEPAHRSAPGGGGGRAQCGHDVGQDRSVVIECDRQLPGVGPAGEQADSRADAMRLGVGHGHEGHVGIVAEVERGAADAVDHGLDQLRVLVDWSDTGHGVEG